MQTNSNPVPRRSNGTFHPAIMHPDPLFEERGLSYSICQRFWAKVKQSGNCWLWTGAVDDKGYGVIGRGERTSSKRNIRARLVSWLMHYGEIPNGRRILTFCGNRSCVNPEHFKLRGNDPMPPLLKPPRIYSPNDFVDMSYCSQDPSLPPGFSMTFKKRWEAKVDKTSSPHGCWLWTGCLSEDGYVSIGKGKNQKGNHVGAHKAAWLIYRGPIPDGMIVCHNCPGGDNPKCVNPAHLWLGTHTQNIVDAIRKQRFTHGHHWTERIKVTEQLRVQIRAEFNSGEFTKAALSRRHKVSIATILKVLKFGTCRDYFRPTVSGVAAPTTHTGNTIHTNPTVIRILGN